MTKRSRSTEGMTSAEGFWVAVRTITPAARPRDTRSRSSSAKRPASFLSTPATYRASSSITMTCSRMVPSRGTLRSPFARSSRYREFISSRSSSSTAIASSRSGPTKRRAQIDHAASSTSLPSKSQRSTFGSSAHAATSIDSATDLPEPGAPPKSALSSANDSVVITPSSLRPSGIGLKMSKRSWSSSGLAKTSEPNGSERMILRVTRFLLAELAETRAPRAFRVETRVSNAFVTSLTDVPRPSFSTTSSPNS